jgi:hypothetical protein
MKKIIRAYLDRIEGNTGVLYLGTEESYKLDLPLQFLPEDINEGDVFNLTISKNNKNKTGKEVEDLRKKFLENNEE